MIRFLLRRFPAASALLAFRAHGEPVPQPPFTKGGFSICVQCWSLKEFSVFEALAMIAAAGAGGVEFYPGQRLGGKFGNSPFGPGMGSEQIEAVKGALQKHHLAAINLGVLDVPRDEAKARVFFDFARRLGLNGITTESIGSIDVLERLAAEYDIKVCFHNHPRPTGLWHPDTIWQALQGRHENLGYCADIGHWAASGLDPLEVVRKIAPRVHAFHMKDRTSLEEPSRDQPLGTGIIDIPGILEEVRKHSFTGNVTVEYEYNWETNLPEIAQCIGYLRALSERSAPEA